MTKRTTSVRWRARVIWSLSALPFLASIATSSLAVDDPAALAEEALAANPSLEALRARIYELDALAGAAGTWSDPVVGIEYSNAPVDSFSLRDHPMSALQLQAQQTIPPWGWSGLSKKVAASRTQASEHALEEAKSQLRREVFELFWELTLSRMLEEVTRQHIARAEELLEAVRARYETGAAGQHQLLRLALRSPQAIDFITFFEMLRLFGFPYSGEASEELPRLVSRAAPGLQGSQSPPEGGIGMEPRLRGLAPRSRTAAKTLYWHVSFLNHSQ